MGERVILGYWKMRGLAQHLRLLLAYTGMEFAEVQYESREKWMSGDKIALGFDFPNLPYLLDGDFKLTEAAAIAKYIINRAGKKELLGKDSLDAAKVNNIIGTLSDALSDIRSLFWTKDHASLKDGYLQKARVKLEAIKQFVGEKDFALGYLTLADFHLAQSLYYFETFFPQEKSNYAFWWRIRLNFQALSEVRSYYKRESAVKLPFLPVQAVISPKLPSVRLGYWGVRGRGQVLRLLLAYSDVQFQDYQYKQAQKWFKQDKSNKGLNFPNLPYLTDGQYNITEAQAIQRYICNRWGRKQLLGKTIQDSARLETLLSVFNEVGEAIRALLFNSSHQVARLQVLQKYQEKLQQLQSSIGDKAFALGYLTLADFIIAQESYYIEAIFPQPYKQWKFLGRIRSNLNSLPKIVSYYSSPRSFKGQFYPPSALIRIPLP